MESKDKDVKQAFFSYSAHFPSPTNLHSFIFRKLCMKGGFYHYFEYPNGEKVKDVHFEEEESIAKLWLFLQIINAVLTAFIKVQISLWLGYTVLAERGVIDSLIHLLYDARNLGIKGSWVEKIAYKILKLVPDNAVVVNLTCDKEALRRRYARRGSTVEPIDYINFQVKANQALSSALKQRCEYVQICTSSNSVMETFKKILKSMGWRDEQF